MTQSKEVLIGMKAIAQYTGRDRATIKKWVERDNFPAVLIDGRWESNTELIDRYRKERIAKACEQKLAG